jgi:hypothetical protein
MHLACGHCITARLGIVDLTSAFFSPSFTRKRTVSSLLAIAPVHSTTILDAPKPSERPKDPGESGGSATVLESRDKRHGTGQYPRHG